MYLSSANKFELLLRRWTRRPIHRTRIMVGSDGHRAILACESGFRELRAIGSQHRQILGSRKRTICPDPNAATKSVRREHWRNMPGHDGVAVPERSGGLVVQSRWSTGLGGHLDDPPAADEFAISRARSCRPCHEFGQPRQIVSRSREGEGPSNALPPPELGFLLSGDCLDPPEGYFDPLVDALTDSVAGLSRRAVNDRGNGTPHFRRMGTLSEARADGNDRPGGAGWGCAAGANAGRRGSDFWGVQARFLKRQLSLPASTMSQ
jgi:hypothetical protein